MAGEGGQRLLNALLVADIGQNVVENDDLAVVAGRDLQAALSHGGEQAQGLDAHRLAAGVGAGDDDGVHRAADGKGHRHGGVPVEQRMAGLDDLGAALFQQLGAHTPHFIAQFAPGKDKVQLAQELVIPADGAGELGGVGRQLGQNALDLDLLLAGEDADVVVELHHGGRLYKEGGAAGAGVVDHAREGAAVFGLHRHHETAVSLGVDVVLEGLGVARGDLGEHIADLGRGRPDLAADLVQLGAGVVGDLLFRHDGVFDLVLQELVAGEHGKIAVQRGLLAVPALLPIGFGQSGGAEQSAYRQQFNGVEKTALFGAFQSIGDVLYAGKGRAALEADETGGVVGLLLQLFTLGQRGFGPQLPAQFLCRGCGRLCRQHFQDLGQFDGGKRLFLSCHGVSPTLL